MKKIISMLCVVAMMLSFVAISANAADIAVSLVANAEKATDDKLAYDVVVKHTGGITGVVIQLDFSDFIAKNAGMVKGDFTAEKVEATGANLVVTGNNAFIASNYTDTNGAKTEVTMFTVYINKANFKKDATFAFKTACKITAMGSGTNVFSSAVKSGATIAAPVSGPNWNKIDATVVEFVGEDPSNVDYAYGVNYTCAGAAAMIFAAGADDARLYSNEIDVTGTAGAVNVGFVSAEALEKVGVLFRDADKANIWYSLDVDKH